MAEMKELIRCGNEPDHRVQLHLCRLSITCLNVTHTHEKIHQSPSVRWILANSVCNIIIIIHNYRPGMDQKFNNQQVTLTFRPNQMLFISSHCHLSVILQYDTWCRNKHLVVCNSWGRWAQMTSTQLKKTMYFFHDIVKHILFKVGGSLKASM